MYEFLRSECLAGVPVRRLAAIVEAVRFTEHVISVEGLCHELLSKRCLGVIKTSCRWPFKPSIAFDS